MDLEDKKNDSALHSTIRKCNIILLANNRSPKADYRSSAFKCIFSTTEKLKSIHLKNATFRHKSTQNKSWKA